LLLWDMAQLKRGICRTALRFLSLSSGKRTNRWRLSRRLLKATSDFTVLEKSEQRKILSDGHVSG
jgi:N-glycosylase/DNA lyase